MSGLDGRARTGVELALNDRLTTPTGGARSQPLRLSIDARVQQIVEHELEATAVQQRAAGGAAVILDVRSGEVLAASSWPFADPNSPLGHLTTSEQTNRVTNALYEMGSTIKVFTVAAALDLGIATPQSVYDASHPIRIGNFAISDFHGQGRPLTVEEVLAHSSNIGTARIALDIGAERLRSHFASMGLLDRLGGELRESSRPALPSRWGRIQLATTSFGHGLTLTPMAVAAGYGAIANGGIWVRPTFLARSGSASEPVSGRQVMAAGPALQTLQLMRDVVSEGTGDRADVDGYPVAGKTGTAEKSGQRGGYDVNRRVSSFAGVFPANEPRYAILVLLDEPKGSVETGGVATAGYTAAPTVARIVARSAPLMGLVPNRTLASLDPAQ
jgi:cell division protein FtsI (penicillin-binding protein 3)